MNRDVTEYDGIKYSLQPHGIRSKLVYAFFTFVLTFGAALAVMTPAYADPTDPPGTCYVAVEASPQPTEWTEASPATTPKPTTCPTTPTPSTTTVIQNVNVPGPTVYITRTEVQTIYVTETVATTPSPAASTTPSINWTPVPSHTPAPVAQVEDEGTSGLWIAGVIVAAVSGIGLMIIGVVGIMRRRQPKEDYQARHASDGETQVMPAVEDDEYSVSDYDPNLGGYAGDTYNDQAETAEFPAVTDDTEETPRAK